MLEISVAEVGPNIVRRFSPPRIAWPAYDGFREMEKNMVDGLAGAATNALTGIEAAQNRIATAATNIAQAPTATATASAPPLTGGRIGTAAGQVQQALHGTDGDLATNLIAVATAKISYEANAKVLGTVRKLDRDTLDIIT
jgi:flagellar basal body rod protein FlgC